MEKEALRNFVFYLKPYGCTIIYLLTSKHTLQNNIIMTKLKCKRTKVGINKDKNCTGLQITMPHAPVFILRHSKGYLTKLEVLPHVRDSSQRCCIYDINAK